MYDRTSACRKVNAARRDLFTCKRRYIEAIPSTSDALLLFPVEHDTTQDSRKNCGLKTLSFPMATRIYPVETNRAKSFLERLKLALWQRVLSRLFFP